MTMATGGVRGIAGVLAGITAALLLMGCGGAEERKHKYRLRAEHSIQAGDFMKARQALRNILRIDPKDAAALFRYAEVDEQDRNWLGALARYERVLDLEPNHEQALIKVGKYSLQSRDDDKVQEVVRKLLALHPEHVPARALQLALRAEEGRLNEALRLAEDLVADHPTDPDATILMAALYAELDQVDRAEAPLLKAWGAHPNNVDVLSALAMVSEQSENVSRAAVFLRRLVDAEPEIYDHVVKLALFHDRHQAFEEAEQELQNAIERHPESEVRHLVLASFLAHRRGFRHAEKALQDGGHVTHGGPCLQLALAQLYERHGLRGQARRLYDRLADQSPSRASGLQARVQLAALNWDDGKPDMARAQLDAVLERDPRHVGALLLHGRMALHHGAVQEAIGAARTLVHDHVDLAEAHALLGQAYMLEGELGLAHESLERAASLDPRLYRTHLTLGILEASAGSPLNAQRRLQELLDQDRAQAGLFHDILNTEARGQGWGIPREPLGCYPQLTVRTVPTSLAFGTGVLDHMGDQWDEAARILDRAVATHPREPEPLFALTRVQIQRGRRAEIRARLDQILYEEPRHPYAHGLLGELLLLEGELTVAERELETATRLHPAWSTPWVNWAALMLTRRQVHSAEGILLHGLDANPRSVELRTLLASSFTQRGHIERAVEEYEAILQFNPKNLLAANNLAATLADFRADDPTSLARALALSQGFEDRAPNPFFLDTLGWVHLRMGHHDEAIRLINRAVRQAPLHPILNYHLGIAHYEAGHQEAARHYLDKALSAQRTFPGIDQARRVFTHLGG